MLLVDVININDSLTINYPSIEALIASEENHPSKQLFIRADGSVAILNRYDVSPSDFEVIRVDLSNGGRKCWGLEAAQDSDWVIKIHDELLRRVPHQHKGVIED